MLLPNPRSDSMMAGGGQDNVITGLKVAKKTNKQKSMLYISNQNSKDKAISQSSL